MTTQTEAAVTVTNVNLFSTTSVETAAATTSLLSTDTDVITLTTFLTTFVTPSVAVTPLAVPRNLELAARQNTASPSIVPIYASACSGTVRYSSACSCIGVTQRATTVAAPTTIVTITNTISVRCNTFYFPLIHFILC